MKLIKFLLISTFATLLALVPVTNTLATEATISVTVEDTDNEYKQKDSTYPKTRTINRG